MSDTRVSLGIKDFFYGKCLGCSPFYVLTILIFMCSLYHLHQLKTGHHAVNTGQGEYLCDFATTPSPCSAAH